jgi:hypothetical protein
LHATSAGQMSCFDIHTGFGSISASLGATTGAFRADFTTFGLGVDSLSPPLGVRANLAENQDHSSHSLVRVVFA